MHVSSTEAKRNLGALLERVQNGEPVEIKVFGKPKAVLISADTFEQMRANEPQKPKREFGALKHVFKDVDANALLAIPIEWPEEYMPDEPAEGSE